MFAWQQAMSLVELVYRDTSRFPRQEAFGLSAQLRRAAISIPCNIAEGAGRRSRGELVQYLGIACGSLAEVETQLEIARRLGYLHGDSDSVRQLPRVGKLLVALRKSIK